MSLEAVPVDYQETPNPSLRQYEDQIWQTENLQLVVTEPESSNLQNKKQSKYNFYVDERAKFKFKRHCKLISNSNSSVINGNTKRYCKSKLNSSIINRKSKRYIQTQNHTIILNEKKDSKFKFYRQINSTI